MRTTDPSTPARFSRIGRSEYPMENVIQIGHYRKRGDELVGTAREAVLGFATLGWRVLPCWWVDSQGQCGCGESPCPDKPGEHPIGLRGGAPNGSHSATADPARV